MSNLHPKTVAIIGAGPVGLAAAAHALERGLEPIVLEAGSEVGHAVRQWGHVRMFSPWGFNIDKAAGRMLAATGWNSPDPNAYPSGAEFVANYLEPLARRTPLNDRIHTSARVVAISRVGFDKVKSKGRESTQFEVRYQNGKRQTTLHADAIIDASGTWFAPGNAGANGLGAIGEAESVSRISYAMPDVLGRDRERFAGKRVAVLGAGHSAIGTLIDLVRLKVEAPATVPVWLLRGDNPEKSFGGGINDKLAARGELGATFKRLVRQNKLQVETAFRVSHISENAGRLRIGAGSGCCGRHVLVDELVVATGFRTDLSFLRELRLALDPALDCPPLLAPLIDPNEHGCGTVRPHGARELVQPEHGFFIAGMKSYGRAPTFLMLTGYEQVRSIVADIAGDKAAAARVELVLPETGVCSLGPSLESNECCGSSAISDASACCKSDDVAKLDDEAGYGCASNQSAERLPTAETCGV